jgi:hypothetical protein
MDRLFSPSTRFYDMLESQGLLDRFRGRPEDLQELSLDVSIEEFLSAERAFSYTDLYAMLGNKNAVVWLTPHAAVMPFGGDGIHAWIVLDGSCRFFFKADGKEIYVLAHSPEHLLEICDILLRILAASAVHSVLLDSWDYRNGLLFNAPTLAHLMEKCQSLKVLILDNLQMDENHCRVLGAYSRPDLKIELIGCKLTSAGTSALAEVLGRNQGPTSLTLCYIDYSFVADGLRGNSRLKILKPRFRSISSHEDVKRQVLAIASALRENKGLVELYLNHGEHTECDETWYAVCDSLKTHPTLQVLLFSPSYNPSTVPAVIMSRIQALLDMMKMNMSIHTIHLHGHYLEHELFQESVIPCLATNRLRPLVLAIQKTRPIPYRAGVLGRALLAARSDANSFWMLLSGNAEVAFPPRTTTIAAAGSLPASATAAAIANVADAVTTIKTIEGAASLPTSATAAAITNVAAAVTASAKLDLTNSATASLPTAATPTAIGTFTLSTAYTSDSVVAAAPNDATPPTDQKRKARPLY